MMCVKYLCCLLLRKWKREQYGWKRDHLSHLHILLDDFQLFFLFFYKGMKMPWKKMQGSTEDFIFYKPIPFLPPSPSWCDFMSPAKRKMHSRKRKNFPVIIFCSDLALISGRWFQTCNEICCVDNLSKDIDSETVSQLSPVMSQVCHEFCEQRWGWQLFREYV